MGAVSSLVGVTVFLLLLLFAVQLTLNLYATSAVTSVAFDAARSVAASDGGAEAQAAAEAQARAVLDRFEEDGGRLGFRWDTSRPDVVVLDVVAERPSLFGEFRLPFQRIERSVRVRWERLR